MGIALPPALAKNQEILALSMVSVDQLCCLDGLIWLQSGNAVGALTRQHQTTVSRNQKKCAKTLGVDVLKRDGRWQIEGDSQLLQLERSVHQVARLKSVRSLRLEASLSADTNLPGGTASKWVLGTSRFQNPEHFSELLKQRVIDAWLTPWSATEAGDAELAWIPLWDKPDDVGLMLQRDLREQHPIRLLSDNLSAQHLLRPFVLQAPGPGGSDSTSPINHQLIP